MTPQREIAIDLLQRFPNAATKTLALKAIKENPSVYKSAESARSILRQVRGARGPQSRSVASKLHRKPQVSGDAFPTIPKGWSHFDNWGTFQIPGPARVLVISDCHIPYHDQTALRVALGYGRDRQADVILLNGDIADFFSVSAWEKDPRKRRFADELKIVCEFLKTLREEFPKARIIYKLGNHEERYERYMMLKAPELLNVAEFSIEKILGLADLGIELVRDMRPIRLGPLNVIHGHEYKFNISNPVNPARGFFLRAKVHCMGSHLHQTSQHSEKNLEEKVISAWSIGCLCGLHPDYRPLNNWNHGFSFVELDAASAFHVENLKIIRGEVY